jgi:hypothetical protein
VLARNGAGLASVDTENEALDIRTGKCGLSSQKNPSTQTLHHGNNSRVIATVELDFDWPDSSIYRIHWPDGRVSDLGNLSRIKDAAEAIAEHGPPRRDPRAFHWKRQAHDSPAGGSTARKWVRGHPMSKPDPDGIIRKFIRDGYEAKALDPDDAQRLAKLCGMFGSDHDGEVINAARKADQLVRSSGETWIDVIAGRQLPPPDWRRRASYDWRTMANACLFRIETLTPKERSFVRSMAQWTGEPTQKQIAWLQAIFLRVKESA